MQALNLHPETNMKKSVKIKENFKTKKWRDQRRENKSDKKDLQGNYIQIKRKITERKY